MNIIVKLIQAIAILTAAIMIGTWFLSEVKKARRQGAPWYAPYLSIPGLLIILFVVILPLMLKIMQ